MCQLSTCGVHDMVSNFIFFSKDEDILLVSTSVLVNIRDTDIQISLKTLNDWITTY